MDNSSEIIGKILYKAGCRSAFGIPGGEVLFLMEGLKKSGIEFVLAKHENCAGFMAEGGYHADRAPGILLATLGPGVANAVNVIANAYQDKIPLIFLTGCVDENESMKYTHQIFDHSELLKSITKCSIRIVDGEVDTAINKAIAIMYDGQPGPVHIDVPIGLSSIYQPEREITLNKSSSFSTPAKGEDLDTARRWFLESEKPLVIAGVDALNDSSEKKVAEFVRKYQIPIITTYKAKGILPEDDSLALGGEGLSSLADKHLLPLVKESDLKILAGYDPIEMRSGWCNPWNKSERVIEFSSVTNTHFVHQSSLSFVCNVGEGLRSLSEGITPKKIWKNEKPKKIRKKLKSIFSSNEFWGPATVIDVVRKYLPRDGVATVDSGAHRILLNQIWECYESRSLLQSTGLCTMGCAVPLAIGFKLKKLQCPVVAFVGDAGMEMVLGELATLRDLKLPILIIVFVDQSLALIELKQRKMKLINQGVEFGATDFPAIADALGGFGSWIENQEELHKSLQGVFERETFTLLACKIGEKAYDNRF